MKLGSIAGGWSAYTQCDLTIEILSLYVLLHSLPRFFYPLFFALPLFILELSIDRYDDRVYRLGIESVMLAFSTPLVN